MQDHGDRRARARARVETTFEAALWTRKNDFRHGLLWCSRNDSEPLARVRSGGGSYIGKGLGVAISRKRQV